MYKNLIILPLFFCLIACNTDSNKALDYSDAKDYAPTQIGSYITYNVSDTLFNLGNEKIASNYEIKIKIAKKISDNSVLEKYTLERYKRPNANASWTLDSIWFQTYTKQKELVQYEINIPYVKLVTPLKSSINWNGNKYNNHKFESYKTRNFEKSYYNYNLISEKDTTFQNTVTIIQNDDGLDAIGYNYKAEIYAKDFGLVYRILNTYRFSQTDTIINKNEKIGLYREMIYNSHGKE